MSTEDVSNARSLASALSTYLVAVCFLTGNTVVTLLTVLVAQVLLLLRLDFLVQFLSCNIISFLSRFLFTFYFSIHLLLPSIYF